jgi:hypothetical protein
VSCPCRAKIVNDYVRSGILLSLDGLRYLNPATKLSS